MSDVMLHPLQHHARVKVIKDDLTWASGHIVGKCKPVGEEYRYDVQVAEDNQGAWILPNVPAQRVYPPDTGPKSLA
jgi:hypothetical protein